MTELTLEQQAAQNEVDRLAKLRANKIAGLRKLADVLDENPGLELPSGLTSYLVSLKSYREVDGEEAAAIKEKLATTARALKAAGLPVTKDYSSDSFTLQGELADGILYEFWADREIVCERKVLGTKTVLKPIMSEPSMPYQVGTEEVEEEEVEWECGTLLGDVKEPVAEEVAA